MKLPKLTEEPILFVNACPDEKYPLRILEAHRMNQNSKWHVEGFPENEAKIYDLMNEASDKRAEILDWAIRVLKDALLRGDKP
jgi:hypothetical protein